MCYTRSYSTNSTRICLCCSNDNISTSCEPHSHVHHVNIMCASCEHHVCIMIQSHHFSQKNVGNTSQHHVCIMCASFAHHLHIMSTSCDTFLDPYPQKRDTSCEHHVDNISTSCEPHSHVHHVNIMCESCEHHFFQKHDKHYIQTRQPKSYNTTT